MSISSSLMSTRYPETMPLRKATSPNITKELVLLFSRVDIPKDILTDQDRRTRRALQSDAQTDATAGGRRRGEELGPPLPPGVHRLHPI
ncbi:hypothetical protein AMELA_G00075990 [Ameiurus melas]|uniref:Uncharacterized protein n=1 Tax=Ameiurus melas TaxID=219545 RepID=A0A7J6AYA9_AMEME|nr:hypothetical protein AMELA_G00075990 [Ameiurus melas]